jgi:peptidoglycan/LPS O-acetylase OafA/YrhL
MPNAMVAEVEKAQSKGSRYYRPELDALRCFAFVCVFFLHAGDYLRINTAKHIWLARARDIGAFGVPVFFLLSAFLITELLFRERERTGRIHVPSFYIRRILRIWPLYFSAFFGLALLNHFVPGTGTDNPHAWLAFTFLCGNWYIFHHGWIASSVDPLWSISIEEQFYLIIPVLAALGGRRAVLFVGWVLLGVAYLAVMFYGIHPNVVAEWTNSFVEFQFFCAGMLIALFLRGRLVPLTFLLRIGGFIAGFVCWFATVMIVPHGSAQPSLAHSVANWLLVLAGTMLFFLCTLGISPRLVPSWLAYFGKISYGLYLVHSLVLFLVFEIAGSFLARSLPGVHLPQGLLRGFGVAVALAISLGLAHLSYVYFEGYFLRLKQRFTFVASRD